MEHTPTFSIVTVAWNAAGVIGPTLESVRQQSCRDFEYLVVDGASTDATVQLVHDAAIAGTRLVSEPDHGIYDAMNKAIGLARGRYLIWLNAGDALATPRSLERMAALAATEPDVIYGQTQIVDARRRVVGMRHLTAPDRLGWRDFAHGMLVCHQAFVARREIVPLYDLRYRYSADYDWCIKVLKCSQRNAYLGPEPVVSFLEEGTTTAHHKASLKERYHIMCHYYGTVPTIVRHLSFLPRYLKQKLSHHA